MKSLVAGMFFIAAFASLPFITTRNDLLNLGVQIFLAIVLAQSWNLLGGYAGQINLGHAAFFGLGALVTRTLWVGGTPLILALFPGALVAMLFGLIIGVPAFRLRGSGGEFFFQGRSVGNGLAVQIHRPRRVDVDLQYFRQHQRRWRIPGG